MEDAGVQRYTDLSTLKSFGKRWTQNEVWPNSQGIMLNWLHKKYPKLGDFYLEPKWHLFLKGPNPPKEGPNSNQNSRGPIWVIQTFTGEWHPQLIPWRWKTSIFGWNRIEWHIIFHFRGGIGIIQIPQEPTWWWPVGRLKKADIMTGPSKESSKSLGNESIY